MPIDSDHSRPSETLGAADDLVTARLRLRRWTPEIAAEIAYGRGSPRWAEDFPADGMLEIGYGIAASRRGRGYATEAVAALTAHARTAPEVRTVFARVSTDSPASVAVLRACGYRATGSEGGILRYEA